MRKITTALLLSALLLCVPLTARGQEIDLSPTPAATAAPEPLRLPPVSQGPLLDVPPIHPDCAAALLMEADSGQIIFQMNADTPRPVASVTKVMTILLTLEQIDAGRLSPGDAVTVSESAAGMGGSQVLLDVNERQTVDTLLRCMIVGSANDAAVALAEAMYGSEALCAEAMNRRAEALGMTGSHFENCTGLPAQGQHTTARDVAIMSRQMFAHPRYFDHSAVWMEDIDHGDGRITQLVNTNKLLRLCDGCDGGKTGSTDEAGYCVSATAKRGDMRLIAVVLGASSGKQRFAIAREMLEYGFANYRKYPVAVRGTRVKGRLPVTGGADEGVALMLDGNLTLLMNKGDQPQFRLVPELPESVPAPVEAGQIVGHVAVVSGERAIARIPVVACETVPAKSLGIRRILQRWIAEI